MKGNWDTYFCRVDDKPAQILLDLELMRDAPLKDYPVLGYVSVTMQEPDENGFPQQEEYELLSDMEEYLVDLFTSGEAAVYVGSCTTDGRYDLFFYMRYVGGWVQSLENAMQEYDGVEWEAGVQEDPEWTSYRAFLFPDDQAILEIQNRRVLEQLEKIGDDLSRSRMIDHFAGFPSEEQALAFAEAVKTYGFILSGKDAHCVTYFPPGQAAVRLGNRNENCENADYAHADAAAHDAAPKTEAAGAHGATSNTTAPDNAGQDDIGPYAAEADEAGQDVAPDADDDTLQDILEDTSDDPGTAETAFRVQFSRPDAPEDIDDVSFPLADLALTHGGAYLGWATPMMK